jgi:hypothetical protein
MQLYCVGMFVTEAVSKGKHGKSYISILLHQSSDLSKTRFLSRGNRNLKSRFFAQF